MITLTFEASKALCDKLTEMGVKLPETYLQWCYVTPPVGSDVSTQLLKLEEVVSLENRGWIISVVYPAPTFSELITDWLPLLPVHVGLKLPSLEADELFLELVKPNGGMPAVSTRVIELVKDLK